MWIVYVVKNQTHVFNALQHGLIEKHSANKKLVVFFRLLLDQDQLLIISALKVQ